MDITEEILETLWDMAFHPHRLLYGRIPKEINRSSASVTIHRLQRKGFIEKGIIEDEVCIRLTEPGNLKLKEIKQKKKEKEIMQIKPRKEKWDKVWRVVVFDIPERNRRIRQALRMGLRMLEFRALQKSVWISKINCTRELRSYIRELGLTNYVLVFETKDLGFQATLQDRRSSEM